MAKKWKKMIKYRMPFEVNSFEENDISTILKKTDGFERDIEKKIAQLKKLGGDINLYSEYLMSYGEEHITILLNELERKHVKSQKTINDIFIRREADKIEIKNLIQELEEKIAKTEEELKFVEVLFEKFNPLYNGKLSVEAEKMIEDKEEEDE